MLDVKKTLAKIINSMTGMQIKLNEDYGFALKRATQSSPWTAPESGIMTIGSGTTSAYAYWYVNDITDGKRVGRATKLYNQTYNLGTSFPVIKGHQYYSQSAGLTETSETNALLYTIVGGVIHNLLKALQSLGLGVVVC